MGKGCAELRMDPSDSGSRSSCWPQWGGTAHGQALFYFSLSQHAKPERFSFLKSRFPYFSLKGPGGLLTRGPAFLPGTAAGLCSFAQGHPLPVPSDGRLWGPSPPASLSHSKFNTMTRNESSQGRDRGSGPGEGHFSLPLGQAQGVPTDTTGQGSNQLRAHLSGASPGRRWRQATKGGPATPGKCPSGESCL